VAVPRPILKPQFDSSLELNSSHTVKIIGGKVKYIVTVLGIRIRTFLPDPDPELLRSTPATLKIIGGKVQVQYSGPNSGRWRIAPLFNSGTGIFLPILLPVLRIQFWDPVLFYPLDPGSGMNFFRILDDFFRILDLGSV
jgi:hypothetical protein